MVALDDSGKVIDRLVIRFLSATFLLAAASNLAVMDAAADTSDRSRYWQAATSTAQEAYIEERTPPGIQVVISPLEGPVYADERGRTLYKWPLSALRNGSTGDRKHEPSNCTDEVLKVSAGLMSPYPAGLRLPDADQRLSCAHVWPPLIASDDAEDVDKWTLVTRDDGSRQWAYDGYPLYTSILDQRPGDVLGGTKIRSGGDGGVVRVPVGPPPDVPAEFAVIPSTTGRLLVDNREYSVYTWDGDEPNTSNCYDDCLDHWTPVAAPALAADTDQWTVIRRSSGTRQWAFRGQPLYTHKNDPGSRSFVGGDEPDWRNPKWHNTYTQRAVVPPDAFTVQDAEFGGQVLADARGRTLYLYNCNDDSLVQLACDHPDAPQEYRLAICGNGDPAVCLETFPYVIAESDAKSESSLWSVMAIDPETGHRAASGQDNALQVWAYRGRPVYTYAGDREAGVTNGDGIGEFTGRRNGYKAFVLRDDFGENAFRR